MQLVACQSYNGAERTLVTIFELVLNYLTPKQPPPAFEIVWVCAAAKPQPSSPQLTAAQTPPPHPPSTSLSDESKRDCSGGAGVTNGPCAQTQRHVACFVPGEDCGVWLYRVGGGVDLNDFRFFAGKTEPCRF